MADIGFEGGDDVNILSGNGNDYYARVDPVGALSIAGAGNTKMEEKFIENEFDTENRWTETIVTGGSKTVDDSILTLTVTTADNAKVEEHYTENIAITAGVLANFLTAIKLGATTDANCIREWGMKCTSCGDGIWFRHQGTSLKLITKLDGVESETALTSPVPSTVFHAYNIQYQQNIAYWIEIDGATVASYVFRQPVWNPKELAPFFNIENDGTATSGLSMDIWGCYVVEQSETNTQIQGVDENGIIRAVNVDSSGRLVTTGTGAIGVSNVLNYEATVGALDANYWQRVLTYNVPTGFTFNLIQFLSSAGNTAQTARVIKEIEFGTYEFGTGVFTDGDAYTGNEFASKLYVYIDTTLAGATGTITVTYTNQDGTTSRTGTVTDIPFGADATNMYRVTLQSGDYGVTDVTAVSGTGSTADLRIIGADELGYQKNDASDEVYTAIAGGSSIVVNSGVSGTIGLDFKATSAVSTERLIKALFTLYPTSTGT